MAPTTKTRAQRKAIDPDCEQPSPTVTNGHKYILEPPLEEEKLRIYKSQVMIHFSLDGTIHAFSGPSPKSVEDADRLKGFSPPTTVWPLG